VVAVAEFCSFFLHGVCGRLGKACSYLKLGKESYRNKCDHLSYIAHSSGAHPRTDSWKPSVRVVTQPVVHIY
jgi:hypothetical protein